MQSRRTFIKRTALGAAAVTTADLWAGVFAPSGIAGALPAGGYGALVTDPAGLLDLPSGFSYKILAKSTGHPLGPTQLTGTSTNAPGDPDAMAAFPRSGGGALLVVNHEVGSNETGKTVPQTNPTAPLIVPTFNAAARGGCTVLELDSSNNVISHRALLAGTVNNCAGGTTPWGTWLTCEETTGTTSGVQHGYVFEVDPAGVLTTGQPYRAMGRFNHEAAAVDPSNSTVYLTEDSTTGLLYRFIPNDKSQQFGSLGNGGVLSAMKVPGINRLAEITVPGTVITGITWVDGPANPDIAGLQTSAPFGTTTGTIVTRSQKLEGCWFGNGKLWFVVSYQTSNYLKADGTAGPLNLGQVFTYDPAANSLSLEAYIPNTPGAALYAGPHEPDNIVVSPYGGAFCAEDGAGPNGIFGIDSTGSTWTFAKNRAHSGEMCGVCFSPDASTMYVTVQNPGIIFAITGPWGTLAEVPQFGSQLLPAAAVIGAVAGGALMLRNRSNTAAEPAVS
jgi:secreted PhoX family phosphatase